MSFPEPFQSSTKSRHPGPSAAQSKDSGNAPIAHTARPFHPRVTALIMRHSGRTIASALLCLLAAAAHADLPAWLQHIPGATTAESALYRLMHTASADILYPRPAREAQTEAARLPADPALYALRAHADEQALDEPAAESDWTQYATRTNTPAAQLELADFYARRLQIPQEVAVLTRIAALPEDPQDHYLSAEKQPSWRVFTRLLVLLTDQALPAAQTRAAYDAFLSRYPRQPAVYARALDLLLQQRDYPAAESLITRYRAALPADQTFPIRAQAAIAAQRDGPDAALALYDRAFQPLWPTALITSYLDLLAQSGRQRAFTAAARAALAAHPDGPEALNALARLFYYDQLQNRAPQARQTLDSFRIAREARAGNWAPEDLYTLAALSAMIPAPAEVARYNFALAATSGNLLSGEPAAQAGLADLTHLLLNSPGQPLALGAGNLTLYRDIATLDQGPGYWNGILSLWLNGTNPASQYDDETAKAQTYFHRSKAAELLAELDRRYPAAPQRPALHAELLAAQAQYGEPAAVIAQGKQFLSDFPQAPQRVDVASLMADAYARQQDTTAEFVLYDSLLTELAAQTQGQPLTAAPADSAPTDPTPPATESLAATYTPTRATLSAAAAYKQILERYLARLVATRQLPQALRLLRQQLDRHPDDPALYERLATFLQQNNLSAQQDSVYKLAIARFQQPTYYDKLARFYLRQKNRADFATLTRQVTGIFSGTDLDAYFAAVTPSATDTEAGPQLALQLNLYAAQRFPHDLVFTRNLLAAYQAKPTADPTAYDTLLRRQWFAADDLQTQFLAYLSRTNQLATELAALAPQSDQPENPAARHEFAAIQIWQSHFEQAAPAFAQLAALYPADPGLGDEAASLFRSLSYLDPTSHSLDQAVLIEQNLLRAIPDDPSRLATLGDLYAETTADAGENLTAAAPFWNRIPTLHPGTPAGYLTTATIFWDYFQYDNALATLQEARTRFAAPTLYAYEAGAIQENRHNLQAAIAEYTASVATPPGSRFFATSTGAAVNALLQPPSDTADSNLQATVQSLFNAADSRARLIILAARPGTAALVDAATAQAVAANPNPTSLALRADILTAQHRAAELAPLLINALAQAKTAGEAAAIGDLARAHTVPDDAHLDEVDVNIGTSPSITRYYAPTKTKALTEVYEAALTRQSTLTPDPVQKLQLKYQLASSLEARKQIPAAQAVIAQVYAANPRILGVVRATVDFYSRTSQPPQAIATLLQAAQAATPDLARSFTLEAATKANDSNNPTQARQLALTLLPATPYDPQVLALIATSYARQNDNAGLKTFYLAQLDQAAQAPSLSRDDRKQDIALLRRGLIPALTRLHDFEGAEAQYIALLSAFPEDAATTGEAALYALRYNRQNQLLAFLNTTVHDSPKDSRFAIDLAQVQTTFENLPAALQALDAAILIRKDRADLYQSRATLELTLLKLDQAAADFTRLYALTYHDPQYQVRIAEIRARQQRPAEAVQALRVAYIEGHAFTGPVAAANAFTIAAQLAQWNLLSEARTYADLGLHLAGPALLIDSTLQPGAQTYARILTRQGHAAEALQTLATARRAANAAKPAPAADAEDSNDTNDTNDTGADTDAQTAQQLAETRKQSIQANLESAVTSLGQTAQTYDTPDQLAALAQTLDTLHTTDAPLALTAATAAGLADRQAAYLKQRLLATPDATRFATYTSLQQSRLTFSDLAQTLVAYAPHLPAQERPGILQQAAQAYAAAGDLPAELRLTRASTLANDATLRDRYFALLLAHNPATLTTLAAGKNHTLAEAVINYIITHGTLQQATTLINARGETISPLWTEAQRALTGLYLVPTEASAYAPNAITVALFQHILRSSDTIDDRLRQPAKPTQSLTGDLWFPYAARFGILLNLNDATTRPPYVSHSSGDRIDDPIQPEDMLPADLEASPTIPANYLDLARTYAEAGNVPAARRQFAHVFELEPEGEAALAAYDEEAVLLARTGNLPAATASWRAGLALLARMQDRGSYPERFFTSFASIVRNAGRHNVNLTPEIEAVLRPYLAHNGDYRSNELLHAVYDSTQSTSEIITLARSASTPEPVLNYLIEASWLPAAAQNQILLARIGLARTTPAANDFDYATTLQVRLLAAYLTAADYPHAQGLLATLPVYAPKESASLTQSRIVFAAHAHTLPLLLDLFAAAPPTLTTPYPRLDPANTLLLTQFIFDQKELTHTLIPANFLALASARLAVNDLPAALQLLHRLTLLPPTTTDPGDPGLDSQTRLSTSHDSASSTPDPYQNLESAAALLESTHHLADSVPFLQSLVTAVPWSPDYKLRLAQAQIGASQPGPAALIAVARDPQAPYATRVAAAKALTPFSQSPDLGTPELTLLTHPHITPAEARQPGFLAARLTVAAAPATAQPDRILLLHEVIAAAPTGLQANQARLDLFLAEADTQTPPPETLALLDLLNSIPATTAAVDPETETDPNTPDPDIPDPDIPDPDSAPGDHLPASAALPPLASALDLPTQTHLAQTLSHIAYAQQHNPAQAVAYLQLAITLDPASTRLPAELKALLAQLAVDQLNQARRPILTRDLDQKNPVRPRLTLAEATRLEVISDQPEAIK